MLKDGSNWKRVSLFSSAGENETTAKAPFSRSDSDHSQDSNWIKPHYGNALFDHKTGMMYGSAISDMETWILPVIEVSHAKHVSSKADVANIQNAEGHRAVLRNLLKTSGIYAVASFISPLLALILSPYQAHALSYSDFGALVILTTFISLVAGITQLGLGSAFFRAYSWDYESPRDRLAVISTTIALMFLFSLPVLALIMITAPWFVGVLLNSPSYTVALRLTALVIFMQNLTIPGFAWLRAENRAVYYSTLTILQLLITLVTTLLFVGTLQMGIIGAILATGSGYAVVNLLVLPVMIVYAGLSMRLDIIKNLLSFGIPIVANFVSGWVLRLSDRYLLGHFVSLKEAASYSAAYNIGSVLSVVIIGPFSLAWPTMMYAIAKKENASSVFRLVFRWFGLISLLATLSLSLLGVYLLDILFPADYHIAAPVIPVVACSTLFYGCYHIFTTGMALMRKMWYVVVFTTIAAIVNIGLNLFLIPWYGSMGAAYSTLLAYIVLAAVTYLVNNRLYPVPYEIGRFCIALCAGLLLYILSYYLFKSQGAWVSLCISFVVLALYAAFLFYLGRFSLTRINDYKQGQR